MTPSCLHVKIIVLFRASNHYVCSRNQIVNLSDLISDLQCILPSVLSCYFVTGSSLLLINFRKVYSKRDSKYFIFCHYLCNFRNEFSASFLPKPQLKHFFHIFFSELSLLNYCICNTLE